MLAVGCMLTTMMPVSVPLMPALTVSVAVIDCVPPVFKVAEKVVCVPASPLVKA